MIKRVIGVKFVAEQMALPTYDEVGFWELHQGLRLKVAWRWQYNGSSSDSVDTKVVFLCCIFRTL